MQARTLQFALAVMLAMPAAATDERLHLLGFVQQTCAGEARCFELRVEAAYVADAGPRIFVRYDERTHIFDPENFELSIERSAIVAGSHLRMLIEADPEYGAGHYRAHSIWKGD